MESRNQNYIEIKDAFKKIFIKMYGYYYEREYMETITDFPLRTVMEYLSAYKISTENQQPLKEFIQRNKDIFLTSLMKFGLDQEFFDISRGERGIDVFANKAFNKFMYTDIREFKPATNDLDKNITLILVPQYFNLYTKFSEYIDWGLKFILPVFLKEVLTLDKSEKSNKKDLVNLEDFERKLKNYVSSYEEVYKKMSYILPILAEKKFFIAQTYNYGRGLLGLINNISKKLKYNFNLSDDKIKELYKRLRNNTNEKLEEIVNEVIENQTQRNKIKILLEILLEKENIGDILHAKALGNFDIECDKFECIYYAIPKVYIPYYEKGENLGYLSPLDVLYFFFLIISENDEKLKRFIFDKLNIQESTDESEAEQQENLESNVANIADFYGNFKEGFISNWKNEFRESDVNIHLLKFNKIFINYIEYIFQKIKPKSSKSLTKYFELVILNFINEFIRVELEEQGIPSKRLVTSTNVFFENLKKLSNEKYAKFIKLMTISPAFMPYYSLEFIEKLEKEKDNSLLNSIYNENSLNKIKEISKNFAKLIHIKEMKVKEMKEE